MKSADCSSPSCSPALSDLSATHPLAHARNNATTRSSDSLCTTASSSSSTSVTFKSEHLCNSPDMDQDEDEQVEREQEEQRSPIHTERRVEEEEDDEEQTDSTMDDDELDTINHTHAVSTLRQTSHRQNQQSGDGQRYPSIPSELILHICRFLVAPQDLRAAILVCKLWCSCGVDMLWSRPHLLSMSVISRMIQTMSAPDTIFPYSRYIRRLNFSFLAQDLTDASLTAFACCTRLERLLLPGSTKTTRAGLEAILTNCSALYSLDLSEVTAVDDALVQYISQHCPRLHTLYLASCPVITDDAIVSLAKNCRSLKRIKLSQCVLLTERSILALTHHCPQLMEMDLANCSLMTNNAIQSVFKTLPQIRDINLTLLSEITDASFSWILPTVHRFEQLRVLNLTSCALITDDTLFKIIPAAPRLRSLTLTKCDRITDAGASVIKTLGKHLHYLHLGHCSKLTDKAISTLAQNCTRIRYLDLACCSKLTDAAVFSLAQLPKLRRIGLVKCSNITDHGIYAMLVSQVVPQTLERVHLSYCVHLSDTAVAALVNQCTKLTHLSVTGVPSFMTPRYQKFCRVPPSEFTAHQREVFCVFSGKGVRELRHYMQENPAVASSNLPNIRRNYRIAGSTVASMVAGGQHSSTILSHLGFTPWPTDDQIESLDVQGAPTTDGTDGTTELSTVVTSSSAAAPEHLTFITLDHQQQEQDMLEQEIALDNEHEMDDGYVVVAYQHHLHSHSSSTYSNLHQHVHHLQQEPQSIQGIYSHSTSATETSSSSSTRALFMSTCRSRNRRSHTLQSHDYQHHYHQPEFGLHYGSTSSARLEEPFRNISPPVVATPSSSQRTSDHEPGANFSGNSPTSPMDCDRVQSSAQPVDQDIAIAPVMEIESEVVMMTTQAVLPESALHHRHEDVETEL
ncbi:SCF ubiquitin ligase complex subunit [Podila epicladia]|nr:SCF ubiquitin ligase complex subunit [Podila epicladia]KAG0088319.1 SCF ubiquitin ligase complex subunit [Podila epicladia]